MMRDKNGELLYVGKAVDLKRRVSQYFNKSKNMQDKIVSMVTRVESIETISVETELEALLLESKLIKEHKPEYNAQLKYDGRYRYIKLTDEPFPRVLSTTSLYKDAARYYGPYTNHSDVEEIIELIQTVFKLRVCERMTRPCLRFHLGKCLAPCDGKTNAAEYAEAVENTRQFLDGENEGLRSKLYAQMEDASEQMFFERASQLRDRLTLLDQFYKRQRTVKAGYEDGDIFAFASSHIKDAVQIYMIRNGLLVGKASVPRTAGEDEARACLTDFLRPHFTGVYEKREIILQSELDEIIIIQSWLINQTKERFYIKIEERELSSAIDSCIDALQTFQRPAEQVNI